MRLTEPAPDISAAIGLGAAADYLMTLGMERVQQHERELLEYAFAVLDRDHPDVVTYGPRDLDVRSGVIPFTIPGVRRFACTTAAGFRPAARTPTARMRPQRRKRRP